MKNAALPQLVSTLRLLGLLLAVFAVLAVNTPPRMTAMMTMSAPDTVMMMDHSDHMAASDAMAKGAGHSACDILCVGSPVGYVTTLPIVQSRLGVLAFVPMALPAVKAQTPDPALRPPQLPLIA